MSFAFSRAGVAFDIGRAPHQMLWVGFPQCKDDNDWRDKLFKRFEPQTRNKIRIGERQGLEAFEATTAVELREAYSIVEVAARVRGAAFNIKVNHFTEFSEEGRQSLFL